MYVPEGMAMSRKIFGFLWEHRTFLVAALILIDGFGMGSSGCG